jgi:hypothetical protein
MFGVGQTWKDRKRNPTSTFTVLRVWEKRYANGETAVRVKGVLVTGVDGRHTHLRDLDARSAQKMFPHILFEPERQSEETPK